MHQCNKRKIARHIISGQLLPLSTWSADPSHSFPEPTRGLSAPVCSPALPIQLEGTCAEYDEGENGVAVEEERGVLLGW
jgi:hypothetical protein